MTAPGARLRLGGWLLTDGHVTLSRSVAAVGEAPVTAGPKDRKAAAGADHRRVMRLLALATVVHVLRSRRFYQRVITVAVALGALRQIGREDQASTMARLAAWDKRQVQRLERKAKRQGQVIKGAGQMMRSGAPRHLTTKNGS